MAEIKLTKNELRQQQKKREQLEKFLPVMQLKKALLQEEVERAHACVATLKNEHLECEKAVQALGPLLHEKGAFNIRVQIRDIQKSYENIAGALVPSFESMSFEPISYSLFDTPAWTEGAITLYQNEARQKVVLTIAEEKKALLEHELKEVSIRVNLFEKVLIPKAHAAIKKIKIFLGDQELAAIGRAKVAKAKIALRKELSCASM